MPAHPHEPTNIDREQVEALSGWGLTQDQIALIIGVSIPTLKKHYQHELSLGTAKAHAKVGQTLFSMAVDDRNTQAAIWWSRARMGWREAARLPEETPPVSTLKVEFRWADDTPASLGAPPSALPATRARGKRSPPTIDGQAEPPRVGFRDDDETSR